MMHITLFYIRYSCAMAVHIALEEAGLPFTTVRVRSSLSQEIDVVGDDGLAALLKVNPNGTVPTLLVDEAPLTETAAILPCIARWSPKAELLPAAPFDYAQCLSRMAWMASTVHIAFRKMNRPGRFSTDPAAHEGIRAFGKEEYWRYLQTLNQMVDDKTWMMGEQFSVVDCHAFVFWRWGKLAGFPVETLTSLSRFSERMLARPAVQRALACEQNDESS